MSCKVASSLSLILNVSDSTFLLLTASKTRLLSICWGIAQVLLGSTGLERGLASLEVASVVFGTDEGEEEEIGGDDTDEDTLDEGVIGDNFGAG